MGRGKSPCCSLLRTGIWDGDQTEFHSVCFGLFPGGGGEKRLECWPDFRVSSILCFTMKTRVVGLYVCFRVFWVIWLDLFHHTWQFTLGFFCGGWGTGSVFFRVVFAGVDVPFPVFKKRHGCGL